MRSAIGQERNRRGQDLVLPALLCIGLLAGGGSTLGMAMDGWLSGLGAASVIALAAAHGAGWRVMAPTWRPVALLAVALFALVLVQLVPFGASAFLDSPARTSVQFLSEQVGLPSEGRISLDPDATERFALRWLLPLTIVFAALGARSTERRRALDAIIVIALGNALLAAAQRLGGPEWLAPWGTLPGAAGGLFANANHLGLLMAVAMVLAFARAAERPLALLVIGSILSLGSLASGSRAAVLLMAFAILASLAVRLARRSGGTSAFPKGRIVLIGLAALAVTLVLSPFWIDADGGWLQAVDREQRLDFWPSLVALAGDAWPWGVGFGAFGATYRVAQPLDAVGPAFVNEAHNEPLQWVVEGGLAGTVLLLVALALLGRMIWSALRHTDERLVHSTALALLLVAAHSVIDYPMRSIAPACMVAVLIGAVLPLPSTPPHGHRGRRGAWAGLILAPLVGLAVTLPFRAATLAQDDAARAVTLRSGQADALAQQAEQALIAGDTTQAIERSRASLSRKPVNPEAVRTLFLARELAGDLEVEWAAVDRMGWRDVPSHVVAFYKARARADHEAMARHAEAVLRRQGGDARLLGDVRVAANDEVFARALFQKSDDVAFLKRLWQIEGDASEGEVAGAAALARLAPGALDPTTLGFVLYRLVERGHHAQARALYLASDPPPPFSAERPDERILGRPSSPFVWRLRRDEDTRAMLDGATLVVRGGLATRGEVASRWLALENGRYRLEIDSSMPRASAMMTVILTCPDGTILATQTSDSDGNFRPVDFVIDAPCPTPILRLEALPGDRRFVARLNLGLRRVVR